MTENTHNLASSPEQFANIMAVAGLPILSCEAFNAAMAEAFGTLPTEADLFALLGVDHRSDDHAR